MSIAINNNHESTQYVKLSLVTVAIIACAGQGCGVTPTTRATVCVHNHETGEPVQGATVVIVEMVMFKSGQASDGGFTGVDGCVTLKAGLLDRMALFIDTPGGAYYSGALSHPRVSSSLTRITLPSTYTSGAPTLEVVLTEVK